MNLFRRKQKGPQYSEAEKRRMGLVPWEFGRVQIEVDSDQNIEEASDAAFIADLWLSGIQDGGC